MFIEQDERKVLLRNLSRAFQISKTSFFPCDLHYFLLNKNIENVINIIVKTKVDRF